MSSRKLLDSVPKGQIIGVGGTGIVELMPDGVVIKRASTIIGSLEINRSEIFKEAAVYARLGFHPRLPEVYTYDENSARISMEFIKKGDLDRRYLVVHDGEVTSEQR
jgi:5-methylthioribose kinase